MNSYYDQVLDELVYYLGYTPDHVAVLDAVEWQDENPHSSLAEYVEAMKEIGAL